MASVRTEPSGEQAAPARRLRDRLGPDLLALGFVVGAFLILRVYAIAAAGPEPYADTESYGVLNFFGGALRTWGLPLFWKLVPGGPHADAIAQAILATFAWLLLAAVTYRSCHSRRVAIGGFVLVLLTGLGVQITEWDMALLSESLTLTQIVLLFSAVTLAVRKLTPGRAVFLGLMVCWWAATRPSNFTILALAFVPLAIGLLLTRRRQVILWVLLPLLVSTVWAGYNTAQDETIWPQNLTGVVQDRLLKDPNAKEYLHSKGMPRSPLVEQESSKEYVGYGSPLAVDPEFRKWVMADLQSAYVGYLIRHPFYTVGQPIKNAPGIITNRTGYSDAVEVLPVTVKSILWPHAFDLPFLFIAVMALGFFALIRTRAWGRLTIPLLAMAVGWAWIIVTWHLASPDLRRIMAPASTVVHVSAVLITIMAIDALLTQRRDRKAAERLAGPVAGEPEASAVDVVRPEADVARPAGDAATPKSA